MTASELIEYLQRKLADGSLPPDEPLFLLRAQDNLAFPTVAIWACRARANGVSQQKAAGALQVAMAMKDWPNKKVPD